MNNQTKKINSILKIAMAQLRRCGLIHISLTMSSKDEKYCRISGHTSNDKFFIRLSGSVYGKFNYHTPTLSSINIKKEIVRNVKQIIKENLESHILEVEDIAFINYTTNPLFLEKKETLYTYIKFVSSNVENANAYLYAIEKHDSLV
jgi:hypothetical protein